MSAWPGWPATSCPAPGDRGLLAAEDDGLAQQLLAVQRAAYRVEARLIGDDRIPPLHETVQDVQVAELRWTGWFDDGRLGGAVAVPVADEGGDVVIDRLVVDPALHRRGIGAALVAAVLTEAGGRRVSVSTGRANTPARELYLRAGFRPEGDAEVLPGLWTTVFVHAG